MRVKLPRWPITGFRGFFFVCYLLFAVTSHAAERKLAELKPAGQTPAKALALKTLDGDTHDLARMKGKVVIVNFWATWCEPCRDEMPSLQRLRDTFSAQGLEVWAVNLDEPESRVRGFLEKVPLKFTLLLDPGKEAAKAWSARILPASYVIGRDGRVHLSALGEIDWNDAAVVKRIEGLLAPVAKKR